MHAQELIARKRDGGTLSADEITFFIEGYTRGTIPDYQAAAWLMAVYLRGMSPEETAALTAAMAHSGEQLDLSDFPHALDKHSTGGVGDKTSLIVVPLLMAAGVAVCKMSGRGLGHTGGTLDKLESIPGFSIQRTIDEMRAQIARIGGCLVGQTETLAPADKKLYALRDATATVGSLPLIVASILSKKLAGGAPAFLFDVKVGNGALMQTEAEGVALAEALVAGAVAQGRRAVALLTDMSQPLGRMIGNALEVKEAIALLDPATTASAEPRLRALCLALAGQGIALALGGTPAEGEARARQLLESGAGLAALRTLIVAQGGDERVVAEPERLPHAPCQTTLTAQRTGWLTGIATQELGEIVVALGGGRARKEDPVDPAVGLELHTAVGAPVALGTPLLTVHAASTISLKALLPRLERAFVITPNASAPPPLIHQILIVNRTGKTG